ncbi:MAG TPA: SCO family protein [Solirubrobacteraceae bacterium]|jgi:protein SCO1/2
MPRTAVNALVTIAFVLALAGCSSGSSTSSSTVGLTAGFEGAALPANITAPAFTLTDLRGDRLSLSGYRGQVVVLAFLYSSCGGACVVVAQQIRGALDELAKPPPVLFVSVDPVSDTPARIARFLAAVSLTGRVRYLTGPLARLRAAWRAYRVVPPSSSRANFDRSVSVLLIDRRGRERVLFQSEQLTPESLAHDIRRLQAEAS